MHSNQFGRFSLTFAVPALVLFGCGAAGTGGDLRAELREMARADQAVRERLVAVVTPGDPESFRSKEAQDAIEEMAAVDKRNQLRLDELVSQHGWPGAAGDEAASAALLIVEHSGLETKERYLALLRHAVEDGQEDPSRLAQLEDEVAVAKTGHQIYGTEILTETGVPVLVPILDPEGLEQRRAQMGLKPIAEYRRDADRDAVAQFGVAVDWSALSSQ